MTMRKKKLPKVILPAETNAPEAEPKAESKAEPSLGAEVSDTPAPVIDSFSATSPSHNQRRAFAEKLVKRFAVWSGVGALIPLPLVDAAAVGGLQIQMLRRISQIYSIPFSDNAGKSIIASIAGTMIPATSGIGAASLLKSIPVAGTIVAGLAMPALSAGATYAIGMAFIEHIVSGGTLLDFDFRNSRKGKYSTQPETAAAK